MEKERKALVTELRKVLGSTKYSQKTALAHAVLDIMAKAPNPRVQLDLLAFTLENFRSGEIESNDCDRGEILMSTERYKVLNRILWPKIRRVMKEIVNRLEEMSVDKLAKKVFQLIEEQNEWEEKDFILSEIMHSPFVPWKFYKGSTEVSEQEWYSIKQRYAKDIEEIVDSVWRMDRGITKFQKYSDLGSYFLDLIDKHKDPKVRVVLMSVLLKTMCYLSKKEKNDELGSVIIGLSLEGLLANLSAGEKEADSQMKDDPEAFHA